MERCRIKTISSCRNIKAILKGPDEDTELMGSVALVWQSEKRTPFQINDLSLVFCGKVQRS